MRFDKSHSNQETETKGQKTNILQTETLIKPDESEARSGWRGENNAGEIRR